MNFEDNGLRRPQTWRTGLQALCLVAFSASAFLLPETAWACRKGRSGGAASIEQARNVPAGLVAFVGKIVAAGDRHGPLTLQVLERIQGDVTDVQVVELDGCMGFWGKVGDTIAVIAERREDGHVLGVGSKVGDWRP
jgi:hypothetical protein